ncbi:MAG: hypothetical protein HY976_02985 [Candidatus Kerfeldbacteria bacterium]|nr:hypothetical protein [Candidatus Kerfeldbacteria bacterium]
MLNKWDQSAARLELSTEGSRLAIIGSTRIMIVDLRTTSQAIVQTISYHDGATAYLSASHGTVYINDSGTVWQFTPTSGESRVIIGSGVRDLAIVDESLVIISDQSTLPLQLVDVKSGVVTGADLTAITGNARFVATRGRIVIMRDGHDTFLFDATRRELSRLAIEDITEVEFVPDGTIATLRSLTDVWELNVNDRQSTLVRRISDLRGASRLPGVDMAFILSARSLEAVDPLYPSAQAGSYEIGQDFSGLAAITDNVLMLWSDSAIELLSFSD